MLIGGAAGGVGVFAVQLARLAGARVIGTGSAASSDLLRGLGAEPVAYGDGLANRVPASLSTGYRRDRPVWNGRQCTPQGNSASRTSASAPSQTKSTGFMDANGANAAPGALEEVARLIAVGQLRAPIAASFPVDQIRIAVEFQASRHAHGKVVIDL